VTVAGNPSGYRFLTAEAVNRLQNLSLVARTVVDGFIAGLHKSPFHGFSVEFSDHREYSPGDNLRYIDWQAYARTDRYYVKQFEEETNLRCHILLDASASMSYGSGAVSKFEYGAFLAASLAYLMIRQRDSVGLVTFDSEIRSRIPPGGTTAHLDRLLVELEHTRPSSRTGVSNTFHALAENIKKRGLIVVISDLFDDERELFRALRHFRHKKHEVIIFHVLDPWELTFPFEKIADFIDPESGERIQADPHYVRGEYLNELNTFIANLRRGCADSFIQYVLADTSVPFELLLTAFLDKRKRLG
jgi:uncharacterized protein (DUF58 family)